MTKEPPIAREEVVFSLWFEYRKTTEYRSGMKKAIPADHPIIIRREREGLTIVYRHIESMLRKHEISKQRLLDRSDKEWFDEWREMHESLFSRVLKHKGTFREVDVTFGGPGGVDGADYYGIPHWQEVSRNLSEMLRNCIHPLLSMNDETYDEQMRALATMHYQFIRIHPFKDGNGRTARAITDQLALIMGFPAAMGGYPRTDAEKKRVYHEAIQQCAKDPGYRALSAWIDALINERIKDYA